MFVFTFDVWRTTDGAAAGRVARAAVYAGFLDVGENHDCLLANYRGIVADWKGEWPIQVIERLCLGNRNSCTGELQTEQLRDVSPVQLSTLIFSMWEKMSKEQRAHFEDVAVQNRLFLPPTEQVMSLVSYMYICIYICVCVCMYMYIYREGG